MGKLLPGKAMACTIKNHHMNESVFDRKKHVLKWWPLLLSFIFCFMQSGIAQQSDLISVTGKVRIRTRDAKEEVVPGISVVEKGTKNGTVTHSNGDFTIRVKKNAVLVVTMVGYKTREIQLGGEPANLNVVMEEDV